MEKIEIQHPDKADKTFSTGAYSAGVQAAGDWLFVSGQAAVDFTTSSFVLGSIEEETHLTLPQCKTHL